MVSPASGDSSYTFDASSRCCKVSNQVVSPASGDTWRFSWTPCTHSFPIKWCHQRVVTGGRWETPSATASVSNQVVSPASGDLKHKRSLLLGEFLWFPIKWCHQRVVTQKILPLQPFRHLRFPIKWCHQRVVTLRELVGEERAQQRVSNQVVSPASGDSKAYDLYRRTQRKVSNQVVSPASGDLDARSHGRVPWLAVSNQVVSPASGDSSTSAKQRRSLTTCFQSSGVTSEW